MTSISRKFWLKGGGVLTFENTKPLKLGEHLGFNGMSFELCLSTEEEFLDGDIIQPKYEDYFRVVVLGEGKPLGNDRKLYTVKMYSNNLNHFLPYNFTKFPIIWVKGKL